MVALVLFALLLLGVYYRSIGRRQTLHDGLYALAIFAALLGVAFIAGLGHG
jgi:hypothetical protein